MRRIDEASLLEVAYEMVKRSCTGISPDAMRLLRDACQRERDPAARRLLEAMIENAELASEMGKPVCQSPGYPTLYVMMGGDMRIDADIRRVFQRAIVKATGDGYMRPSMVHPISRRNSGDNSGLGVPDLEIDQDPGVDHARFIISFKGCGAELANVLKVLTPTQVGEEGSGIRRLVLEIVVEAGGIPCPPVAIGIGIGGQTHTAAKLSRRAVSIREWTDINPDEELASMEMRLLSQVNSLGIGPGGIGGDTTALTVKVEMVSTHTAICPVAINFHCWTARRSGAKIYPDGSVEYLYT
ncbi:fumarate hydratase [Candidatus Bathyarchaeota archaeon]|nr:fumarate hydratase [Candidatus Bathyarchaeota archaeon]